MRKYIDFSLLLLPALFFFRGSLFNTGYPLGADAINWIAYPKYQALHSWWFSAWEGVGFPGTVGQILPLHIFITFLFYIFDSPIGVKLLIFATYVTAGVAMYSLAYHWFRERNIALISGLLYMLGRPFLDQIIQGQLTVVLAYAIFPLLPLAWDQLVRKRDIGHVLFAAMVFSVYLGSVHPSFVNISAFIMVPFVIWDTLAAKTDAKGVSLWQFSKPLALFALALIVLSMVFLLPALAGRSVSPSITDRPYNLLIGTIYKLSTGDLLSAFTLEGIEGKARFPDVASGGLLVILPVLAFSALIFQREKRVIFLTLIALVYILLTTGPFPPFSTVYLWMLDHLPYFSGVRSPARGLLLVAFCYALLAATSINAIYEFIRRWSQSSPNIRLLIRNKEVGVNMVPALITAVLILGTALAPQWPALRFGMKSFQVPPDYLGAFEYVKKQPGDVVVMNLPFQGGEGWIDPLNPGRDPGWSSTSDYGLWSSAFHGKTVLAYREWYPYSRFFLEFNNALVNEEKPNSLTKFLGGYNVKYVLVLPNAPDAQKELLARQEGLKLVYEKGAGKVYENLYWVPRLFPGPGSLFAEGDPRTLTSLLSLRETPEKMSVPQISLLRDTENIETQLTGPGTIVFTNGDFLDILFYNLNKDRKAFVADAALYLPERPTQQAPWAKNDVLVSQGYSVASLDWSYASTGGDGAYFTVPFEITSPGDHEVWLRVLKAPTSHKLLLSVDDEFNTEVYPNADSPYIAFQWVKGTTVNLSMGTHTLKVASINVPGGDSNDIDQIAIVEPSILASETQQLERTLQNHQIVFALQQDKFSTSWEKQPDGNASDGYRLFSNIGAPLTFTVGAPKGGLYRLAVRSRGQILAARLSTEANGERAGEMILGIPDVEFQGTVVIADESQATFWTPVNPLAQVAISDSKEQKQSGDSSLKIDILAKGRNSFSLFSKGFDQPQDWSSKKYLSFWFKGINSGVPLLLAIYSNERRYSLIFSDNSDQWTHLTFPIRHNPGALEAIDWSKVTSIQLAFDSKDVTGSFYLDSVTVSDNIASQQEEGNYRWTYLENPLHLKAGENTLRLKPLGLVWLDMIALYSLDGEDDATTLEDIFTFTPEEAGAALSYERVDPTHYEAHVKADSPFLLHFSEAYHPLWRAYVDGEEIEPILVNGFFNGYMIDKVGEYDISIKYKAQRYVSMGAKISGITILLSLIYFASIVIKGWRRGKI